MIAVINKYSIRYQYNNKVRIFVVVEDILYLQNYNVAGESALPITPNDAGTMSIGHSALALLRTSHSPNACALPRHYLTPTL